MKYPGAGAITKLAFSHSIKEKLEKPRSARQCCKQIVGEQWCFLIAVITKGFVTGIQYHAPDKISSKPAPEQHDINHVIPKQKFAFVRICRLPGFICNCGHRLSRLQPKIEASAEHARYD